MDVKMKRRFAWTLYALGGAVFLYYFLLELDGERRMEPLDRILLLGAGCACVYAAGALLCRTVGRAAAAQVMRGTFRAFFLVYLLLLLTFTLFDDAFGRGGGAFTLALDTSWETVAASVNLTPFKTIRLYLFNIQNDRITWRDFVVNIVGNLCAFMPMAFFLPLLFKRFRNRLLFFVTVTLSVAAIEALQLLSRRGSCDVDDLLLNVAGAVLLYELLRLGVMRRLVSRLTLQ